MLVIFDDGFNLTFIYSCNMVEDKENCLPLPAKRMFAAKSKEE